MKVFVTGAAGFVGTHLRRRLIAEGHTVMALDSFVDPSPMTPNLTEALKDNVRPGIRVTWHTIDIGDATVDYWKLMFEKDMPDAVIHLGARPFIPFCEKNVALAMKVNAIGTHRLATAAASCGVKKFVFASTAAVYSRDRIVHAVDDALDPPDVYGVSKVAAESFLRQVCVDRIPLTICRLFNVYGEGETHPFFLTVLRDAIAAGGETVELGNLDAQRDFIYIDDIVSGLIEAATGGYEGVVNLGTGTGTLLPDAIELARDVTGKPLRVTTSSSRMRKLDRKGMVATLVSDPEWRWRAKCSFKDMLGAYLEGKA
jgi:UDP-glucose 4-epimerase